MLVSFKTGVCYRKLSTLEFHYLATASKVNSTEVQNPRPITRKMLGIYLSQTHRPIALHCMHYGITLWAYLSEPYVKDSLKSLSTTKNHNTACSKLLIGHHSYVRVTEKYTALPEMRGHGLRTLRKLPLHFHYTYLMFYYGSLWRLKL